MKKIILFFLICSILTCSGDEENEQEGNEFINTFKPPSWILGTWSDTHNTISYEFLSDNIIGHNNSVKTDFSMTYGDARLIDVTEGSTLDTYSLNIDAEAIVQGKYLFTKKTETTLEYRVEVQDLGDVSVELVKSDSSEPQREFAYVCQNGIPDSNHTTTPNTEKCASCDGDYTLASDRCVIETFSFVCANGVPVEEVSAEPNVENCLSCNNTHYLTCGQNHCGADDILYCEPKKQIGQSCNNQNERCISQWCDGVSCKENGSVGSNCRQNEGCLSGFCSGTPYINGQCTNGSIGSDCRQNISCLNGFCSGTPSRSGQCTNGLAGASCLTNNGLHCATGFFCDYDGNRQCKENGGIDFSCSIQNNNADCNDGLFCGTREPGNSWPQVCTDGSIESAGCQYNWACASGFCASHPYYRCTDGSIGSPCIFGDQCANGWCDRPNEVCKADGSLGTGCFGQVDCAADLFCSNSWGGGVCTDGSLGSECFRNSDCASGFCSNGGSRGMTGLCTDGSAGSSCRSNPNDPGCSSASCVNNICQ